MSQFNFINDMNSLLNLDSDLKMQSKPRWQRKNDASINSSNFSMSYNTSMMAGSAVNTTATGSKTPSKSIVEGGGTKRKTPNDKKSPGKNRNFKSKRSSDDKILFQGAEHRQLLELAEEAMAQRHQMAVIVSFPTAAQ